MHFANVNYIYFKFKNRNYKQNILLINIQRYQILCFCLSLNSHSWLGASYIVDFQYTFIEYKQKIKYCVRKVISLNEGFQLYTLQTILII